MTPSDGEVTARLEIAAGQLATERAIAAATPAVERALLTLAAGGPLHLAHTDLAHAAHATAPATVTANARRLLARGLARLGRPTIRPRTPRAHDSAA